jgi:hypothetical protein
VKHVDEPAPADELLSAEVVLRGPDGDPPEPISGENLAQHRPDETRASAVREWFQRHGFDTTDVHGISFSITGPRHLFEKTYATPLVGEGAGPGVDIVELPSPADMPSDLADDVVAVTFTPPPAFGPRSY